MFLFGVWLVKLNKGNAWMAGLTSGGGDTCEGICMSLGGCTFQICLGEECVYVTPSTTLNTVYRNSFPSLEKLWFRYLVGLRVAIVDPVLPASVDLPRTSLLHCCNPSQKPHHSSTFRVAGGSEALSKLKALSVWSAHKLCASFFPLVFLSTEMKLSDLCEMSSCRSLATFSLFFIYSDKRGTSRPWELSVITYQQRMGQMV